MDLNLTVGAYTSRLGEMGFANAADVVEAAVLPEPGADVMERLALESDASVTYLLRRLLINGEPAAIHRSWLPTEPTCARA